MNKNNIEHFWQQIIIKLGNKVDKVEGKGLSTNDYTTDEKTKLAGIADGATKVIVDSALSTTSTNPVQNKVVNTAIGNLTSLVGNTAVATQISTAIASKADLDTNGKVPSSQLPSYVDDVIEYNGKSNFPSTGESGKIYVDTATNLTYRWSGSAYVEISPSLALGETSSTAYRGDRGKTAYDHSQSTHARTDATKTEKSSTNGNIKINGVETNVYTHPSGTNPHGTTKSDVGLGNVGNFKAVSTVASQGLTDTEKSNARANIGAGTSNFSGSYNDLSNKPTIPTVGNGTITIKQAGSSKGTFTLNQSGNTTIELTDNDTTYSAATTSANGLMSKDDKAKLDGIATGANKTTVDSALSSTSTNPVQNKVINTAISSKANSDLTNINNATFKAKVEASGFSSGTQVQILTWPNEITFYINSNNGDGRVTLICNEGDTWEDCASKIAKIGVSGNNATYDGMELYTDSSCTNIVLKTATVIADTAYYQE